MRTIIICIHVTSLVAYTGVSFYFGAKIVTLLGYSKLSGALSSGQFSFLQENKIDVNNEKINRAYKIARKAQNFRYISLTIWILSAIALFIAKR